MDNLSENEFDILIVGGGVAGVSCAYWLTKLHKLKIGIIDSDSIKNWSLSQEMSNLSVGSIKHLFDIYKKYGVEKVIKNYDYMLSNLDLISKELNLFQTDGYVDFFTSGTINKISTSPDEEFNHNSIEEFLLSIAEKIDEIEKVKSDDENLALKISHHGTYNLKNFFHQVLRVVSSEITMIEGVTCNNLRKSGELVQLSTSNGEYTAKKVIFSNGNGLDLSLPELKDKIRILDSYVFECQTDSNEVDRSNYIDTSNSDFFYRNKDKVLYGVQGEKVDIGFAKIKFKSFCEKNFPEASQDKSVKTRVAFSEEAFPLCGKSTMNSNLYYLGGFSGQSKKYAFKMAHDLVQRIKI